MTFWAAILPRRGGAIVAADRRMTDCAYNADGTPRPLAFTDEFGKIIPFPSGWIIDTLPPSWKGRWSAADATVEDIGARLRPVAESGMRDMDEATAKWYRLNDVPRLLALHATPGKRGITLHQWAAVDGRDLGTVKPGVYVGVPPGPAVEECDVEIAKLARRTSAVMTKIEPESRRPNATGEWAMRVSADGITRESSGRLVFPARAAAGQASRASR